MKAKLEKDITLEKRTKEIKEGFQDLMAQERSHYAETLTAVEDLKREQEEAKAAVMSLVTNELATNPVDTNISDMIEAFAHLKKDVYNLMEQWREDKEKMDIVHQKAKELGFMTLEDLFEAVSKHRYISSSFLQSKAKCTHKLLNSLGFHQICILHTRVIPCSRPHVSMNSAF